MSSEVTQRDLLRFQRKVCPIPTETGCLRWTGSLKGNSGYGRFTVGGVLQGAHRASYRIFKGPIPSGMRVCHTCDNPWCVNPDHLWLGTHADDIADKCSKGRQRGAPGESHGMAKLTDAKVRQMRAFRADIGFSYGLLSKMFGVHSTTCKTICEGKTWRHLLPNTVTP